MTTEELQAIAKNPKAFLQIYHQAELAIWVKKRRIAHLRQISVQITTTIKAVSAYTGPGDKVGECASEIAALTEEIEKETADLASLQRRVEAAIQSLVEDDKQRAVLEARYLAELSWEEIAYNMHYAYRWVLRLHKRGLLAMQEAANGKI